MSSIAHLRREYTREALREADFAADPIEQFSRWFDEARQADLLEPNAMTLATAAADGMPSARIVLLKGFDADGFVFYTSYLSDKAGDLADNPQAEMCFWWDRLQRQVRIQGQVGRVTREETQAYFATRPRPSQIGAWASRQSQPIENVQALADQFIEAERRFQDQNVPTPPFWGGYRLMPRRVEFWQGQQSRLHDRLLYRKNEQNHWRLQRLAP